MRGLLLLSLILGTAQANQVTVQLGTFRKDTFVSVGRGAPGDVLVYRATVQVTQPLKSLTFSLPLASTLMYAGKLNIPQGSAVAFGNQAAQYPQRIRQAEVRVVKVTLPRLRPGTYRVTFNVMVR